MQRLSVLLLRHYTRRGSCWLHRWSATAIAAIFAATVPIDVAATDRQMHRSLWPHKIDLDETGAVRDFTPGIEEPALYALLRVVRRPDRPSREQADRLDRETLLAEPAQQRGRLMYTEGRFWDAKKIHLAGISPDEKITIWSTRAFQLESDQPLQILSILKPGNFGRLEKIRCIGYFYKIRQEPAAEPDRSGRKALVSVPVLVGWVLAGQRSAKPRHSGPPLNLVLAATGVLILLLILIRFAIIRRRRDWRSRLRQARPQPPETRSINPVTMNRQVQDRD